MLAHDLLFKLMEYSLIVPTAGRPELSTACALAKARHFGCVSVFPCWLPFTARQLAGSDVKCGVTLGYPYGVDALAVKVYAAQLLTKVGASELEVFVNVSALKAGDFDVVIAEAEELKDIVTITGLTHSGEEGLLKVAVPVDYLEPQELMRLASTMREANVDFLTLAFAEEDPVRFTATMRVVRDCVGADVGIKVMCPTMSVATAIQLADLGANRLGAANFDEMLAELDGVGEAPPPR